MNNETIQRQARAIRASVDTHDGLLSYRALRALQCAGVMPVEPRNEQTRTVAECLEIIGHG